MFYAKLAWSNLKKSLDIFGPFLLASVVLFILDCSTLLILFSPVSDDMRYSNTVLGLAIVVLMIFTVIMEIYSYNFLLKQRSREFGLYNILGMNRRQVGLVSTIELAIMFVGVIVIGSILSAIFSQLFYLIFVNLLHYDKFVLTLSPLAFMFAAFAFVAIFVLLEVINLVIIHRSSPLALFKRQEKGEKEPRGNIILALLSIISLGIGYYMSISSAKVAALVVVYRFFIAVVLVIIGTYLFYVSFMTWYLKRRRKNKNYFYQPEHFVTTAQMIFRMKQNAVGLANITLLATMTFVTIATTTSLYVSGQNQANILFPKNTQITFSNNGYVEKDSRIISEDEFKEEFQNQIVDKLDKPSSYYITYQSAMSSASLANEKVMAINDDSIKHPDVNTFGALYLTTQDAIQKLGNDLPKLKDNQIAFYKQKGDSQLETLTLFDKKFENVKNFKDLKFPELGNTYNPSVIIFSNNAVMEEMLELFKQHDLMFQSTFTAYADLSTKDISTISDGLKSDKNSEIQSDIYTKKTFMNDMYAITGGFLFTGFLLGLSFLLGAALIIYYKQRTEGIEDKKSYKILQEVGMSKEAVKRTVNSQTLLVFFMPLGVAILHFVFALTMLKQMLLLFGVAGSSMVTVSGITILCLVIIYFFIYKLTSRTYYKLINR
ncbi:FtsX-like permease family protein [Streptococcus ruminicola]|uniref:FtsX-like permease family protein n=1 Tax=Streptococcus ruminicola TaxID=2686210 RepID=A0AAE6R3V3_9STRE|nr:FtsX-like permease family protein [Streptococcus ruminicola]QGZ27218.1 FtsX-like permease family protein [Streptococcus ruminicola]WFM80888.1 FtsX-like permease family protein [Streptococcus ruminicola]